MLCYTKLLSKRWICYSYASIWKISSFLLFFSLLERYKFCSLQFPLPQSLSHHYHLFFSLNHPSQSLSILVLRLASPLLFPHCLVVKRGDLDSLRPLMWAMWPQSSRCPYAASLIRPAERKPVINPVQPGPPLHCLNTWCITAPTASYPPCRIHPYMHVWVGTDDATGSLNI